ncbi:unnamed protein product [Pylaiella littoralis]
MVRYSLLPLIILFDAAQAFVGIPMALNGRGSAVYTKGWGSSIAQHTSAARLAAAPPCAVSPPSMSLMVLADDAAAAPNLPVSMEQQETIISVLSVASSALLLIIIGGAVYLSLAEWKNKKELEDTDKFTSAGQLPPEIAKEATPANPEEEGNRLQRRMMKKEKRKSGKI